MGSKSHKKVIYTGSGKMDGEESGLKGEKAGANLIKKINDVLVGFEVEISTSSWKCRISSLRKS